MHYDVAMRHAPILSVNVTGTCRSVLSVNWSDRYGAHTPVVTGSGQWIPSHLFWRVPVLGDSAALDYAVLGHSNMTFHTECPPSCRCPTQQRTSARGSFVLLRFVGSLLQRHCENTFWAGIGVGESKVGWIDKVIGLHVKFLLAPANGWACVDFGCRHPIDGLFWNPPIYLLGFFSKYEWMLGNWFKHVSIAFYCFWVVTCLYHEVSYHYEM
jgi:hypothetical protein